MIELGQQVVELEPDLESLLRKAAPLTEYAWKFRYPGEPEPLSQQEAEETLAMARRVFEALVERLPGIRYR